MHWRRSRGFTLWVGGETTQSLVSGCGELSTPSRHLYLSGNCATFLQYFIKQLIKSNMIYWIASVSKMFQISKYIFPDMQKELYWTIGNGIEYRNILLMTFMFDTFFAFAIICVWTTVGHITFIASNSLVCLNGINLMFHIFYTIYCNYKHCKWAPPIN